ncbi:MAG TPA: DoxX family protein [Candidatus Angelobacter sp.]|nr:DoxX family protein [Candidatus Angelobacter sp.]
MRLIAHVDYVTEPGDSPDPVGFLLDTLADPASLLILAAGALAVAVLVLAWARWRPLEGPRQRFVVHGHQYAEFVPWMIRLSVGLVLVGAGLSRVLFMPTLPASTILALLLTAAGFLILVGLAVRPAAIATLGGYLVALVANPGLVMMFDLAGGLAAAAVLGPGRPSLDDLLRAAFPRGPGARAATENLGAGHFDDFVPLLVRIGLGGAFAASGIADKLLVYDQALAAVEQYQLTSVVPVSAQLWVVGAFLVETALGLAILLGVLTRASAVVGFAVLTLAMFALPDDPVIAHVGLFGLASVLVVLGAGRWSVDRQVLQRIGDRIRASPS